jgi:hypothetical protein
MRTDLLAALAAALVLAGCADDGDGSADRQADVAERGAQVMPFDLDVTTHRFEPTDNGLIETVVADRPDDAEQVALVQQHLTEEAGRFRNGDYGDPAAIHCNDMPGLAVLEDRAASIAIDLTHLADGARLTFTADDPALVDALHLWGKTQTADHGQHAE